MKERDTAPEESSDEFLLRASLHALVEDVEPERDSLARLLSRRRRRSVVRSAVLVTGVAVATTAVLLFVLVVPNGTRTADTDPVGLGPDSYATQLRDGVLAAVSVESGRVLRRLGELDGAATEIATDRERVYAAPAEGGVVVTTPEGTVRPLERLDGVTTVDALAASAGRVAVASGNRLLVLSEQGVRRIVLPAERTVRDVAVDPSGRLALAVARRGAGSTTELRLAGPEGDATRPVDVVGPDCAPLRVAWTSTGLAVLHRVSCAEDGDVRVTTLDPDSGATIGGGVRFAPEIAPEAVDGMRMTSDSADRLLVSTPDRENRLVEGGEVRSPAAACTPEEGCPRLAAAM
ncbi:MULTISPECIES: hypothetical protein [unclassified Actinopolyspora]|uniref:hypothetical protein n=1 Tax=Actinopolyspora TaxID=1849 RepID=UPI0013F5D54A|nr:MULTISPECIES: hypothetical protein [unclassified Actinopolyspora]NHD18540.1 hypothetical protein [Actinopolyspora sp. BKK2]NHE77501.1 hypothetical protein [Actinopolyspora sp. BKK1]